MKSSSKGSSYERTICKQLSLWWTHGERDDIFWRSSGSGARAKVRGRAGIGTAGQHGDVAATDPIGEPLIRAFTIEIKRGYSGASMQDLIDSPGSKSTWYKFLEQAIESHIQAGSWSWMLITKRDRREPLTVLPYYNLGSFINDKVFLGICKLRTVLYEDSIELVIVPLEAFLDIITPEQIQEKMKDYGHYNGSR
jgi:hypothetical protein